MPDPFLDALVSVRQQTSGGGDPFLAALSEVRAEADAPKPSLMQRAIPTAMRIVPTVAGGFLGSALGPVGTAVGGYAGGSLGEFAAERYEQLTGQRQGINPTQVAVQGALGAIPLGKVAGSTIGQIAARRAAQGAGMGAVATGATSLAETGELPSVGTLATGTVLGGLVGGGAGAAEGRGLSLLGRLGAEAGSVPPARGLLPAGARFVAGPHGQVAPAGTDIPMTAGPDGSFVRSVPGEYARREVRGLLPAGPRFAADAAGNVAPVEQADALSRTAQSSRPEDSSVRSVPAAAIARDIDPTHDTAKAVSVRQYSGDPEAVEAPLIGERERHVLSVMRQDLHEFRPERGRLIRDPQDPASSIYSYGGPGSSVADDIRAISDTRAGNAAIARAVDDLLEGKPITNKLHVAALDAAQGYLEGRSGYRGPQLPIEGPGFGGDADEFERFASSLDEIADDAPRAVREPGEEGFIANALIKSGGGALAGAATGAATGDTPRERVENALLFGAAGAGAPALIGALVRKQPAAPSKVVGRIAPGQPGPRYVGTLVTKGSQVVQGMPRRDPLAGMESFFSKFTNPLARAGVKERVVANAGFDAQRRGVLNVETLGALGEQVTVDLTRSLPRGSALNAESVTAYARAVDRTMARVRDLSDLVNTGKATDADVVSLAAARADADVVLKSLMGARSEAGRALAMFRTFSAVLETGDVNMIRSAANGLREDAAKLAGQVRQLVNPLEQYRFLQSQRPSSLMDKARSYYYANILSGVKTHERNILGNTFSILTRLTSTPITAALDAAQSAATGRSREVFAGELKPAAVGAVAGFERGLRDFVFTLRHGVSPDALTRSVGAALERGQLDVPRVEFGGGAGNPFNWPGRMLDAADALFRATARNMELYASAYTQARKQGLSGERLIQRAADLRADATLQGQAAKYSAESIFQHQPGPVTGLLQAVARKVPAISFVIPFIKTPANILRAGVQASPAGFLTPAAQQGGRAGVQVQGMAAAGSLLLAPIAWLAATGRLSGSGPRDATERAALMESGWRPNSVRIGDEWVEYSLFQPVSVQAAIVANAFEAWQQAGAKAEDVPGILTQVLARSGRSLLDQSFLSGLYDFLEAVNNPERFSSTWAGRFAHSLTPFAGAQRTVAQALDPTIRQPRTAGEVFASNVPGLSKSVTPRIDRFGQDVQRPGGARAAVDPFNVSGVVNDPVAAELSRLGIQLTLPSDQIALPGGMQLSPEQALELRRGKGQQVRTALERLVSDPRYQQLPDDSQRALLKRAIDRARDAETRRTRGRVAQQLRRQQREQQEQLDAMEALP